MFAQSGPSPNSYFSSYIDLKRILFEFDFQRNDDFDREWKPKRVCRLGTLQFKGWKIAGIVLYYCV